MSENLQLTPQQQEALDRIKEFIHDDEKDVFVLKGYAGTGKTTLIKEIVKLVEDINVEHYSRGASNPKFFTKIAAPTGRAVKVLEDKLKLTRKTAGFLLMGLDAGALMVGPREMEGLFNNLLNTVHGHIYDPLNLKFNPKEVVFNDGYDLFSVAIEEKIGKNYKLFIPEELKEKVQKDKNDYKLIFAIKKYFPRSLIIVDEASMLSGEKKQEDDKSFSIFGTGNLLKDLFTAFPNGKFIFIGDDAQLPPVGTSEMPALNPKLLEEKFHKKVESYELTQIVREYRNNDIIKAVSFMRLQAVENPFRRNFYVKGLDNIFVLPDSHFLSTYIQVLKDSMEQYGPMKGLFQALNKNIMIVFKNKTVHLFNDIIRKELWPGKKEKLVPGDILMVTQNNVLTRLNNGDLVQVLEVGAAKVKSKLTFREVKVKNLTDGREIGTMLIEDVISSGFANISEKQYRKLVRDFIIDLYKKYNLKELDKEGKIKERNEKIFEAMANDPYINALRAIHGYTVTCHKAQGGEWDNVFVYLDDILLWHRIKRPFNWTYTAFTRAKDAIIVNAFSYLRPFKYIEPVFCEHFPDLCNNNPDDDLP